MTAVDFNAVERLVPMAKVLELLGWVPKERRGKELRGWCPIHSDASSRGDAFATHGNQWYCHKCRLGGGPLRLWYLTYLLTPREAAVELCRKARHPVPYLPRGERTSNR